MELFMFGQDSEMLYMRKVVHTLYSNVRIKPYGQKELEDL